MRLVVCVFFAPASATSAAVPKLRMGRLACQEPLWLHCHGLVVCCVDINRVEHVVGSDSGSPHANKVLWKVSTWMYWKRATVKHQVTVWIRKCYSTSAAGRWVRGRRGEWKQSKWFQTFTFWINHEYEMILETVYKTFNAFLVKKSRYFNSWLDVYHWLLIPFIFRQTEQYPVQSLHCTIIAKCLLITLLDWNHPVDFYSSSILEPSTLRKEYLMY